MILDGIIVLLTSYVIGSFPTAVLAGKLQKNIDIREHGSGNAGATNVLRVLGWKTALVVLLIDMFKGFGPVFWITPLIHSDPQTVIYFKILAAIGAVSGHIWTLFAGFKGGKGVGTSAGVFLGLAPLPLLLALLSFIIIVAVTKYVSLGSILSALIFLSVVLLQKYTFNADIPDILVYLASIIVLLIWILHKSNIKRLLSGTENKVSFKRSGQD